MDFNLKEIVLYGGWELCLQPYKNLNIQLDVTVSRIVLEL